MSEESTLWDLPSVQGDPQVDQRVAVAHAALHLRAHALLDARDELARYGAADDLVHELEPAALGQRLDGDVADGVLAVTAGLLDVAARGPSPAPAKVSRSETRNWIWSTLDPVAARRAARA